MMSTVNIYSFRGANINVSTVDLFSPYLFTCPNDHHLFVALADSYKRDFNNRSKLRCDPVYRLGSFDCSSGDIFPESSPVVIVSSEQFQELFALDDLDAGVDLLLSEFGQLPEGGAVGDTSPEVAERKPGSDSSDCDVVSNS